MEYKQFLDLTLSKLGIGTYLGEPDGETGYCKRGWWKRQSF